VKRGHAELRTFEIGSFSAPSVRTVQPAQLVSGSRGTVSGGARERNARRRR